MQYANGESNEYTNVVGGVSGVGREKIGPVFRALHQVCKDRRASWVQLYTVNGDWGKEGEQSQSRRTEMQKDQSGRGVVQQDEKESGTESDKRARMQYLRDIMASSCTGKREAIPCVIMYCRKTVIRVLWTRDDTLLDGEI